ncbi:MAG: flagellar export chaperone FliS [Candidatus Wallbacteria bacterium]|nr:flagellar export chaperone FliS [Candidatus Wallbacteria bacterium]
MNRAVDTYKKTRVQTVDEGKLLLMLYDGALQFLSEAEAGINGKNVEKAHNSIIKVQKIVTELMVSLNLELGGDIARNLQSLYVYVNRRLLAANVKKDREIIGEVREIISSLRNAFADIVKKSVRPKTEPGPVAADLVGKLNLQG